MENLSVTALAKELIACPSITPNDAGCQQIIAKRLTSLGFQCETMHFGDVHNLWARLGTQAPLLVFAGHTDVVPPGRETDWTSSPFKPEIRHGYLYGRGATDMKGALAAMIIAVEEFLQHKRSWGPGSLAFLITSDEEGQAINGTKKVIETLLSRQEKIDYCIIGEASSDQQIGDQIRIGRRGSLHGKMQVHGKQGHVANPQMAHNPIHHTAIALYELAQHIWDDGNEHYPPTTFQITNIHSGTGAVNVIPGHLEALFNFRFSTASTVAALQHATEAILKKHHLNYELNWDVSAHPFISQQGKLISIAQQVIFDLLGLQTRLSTGGGTSDGRFIAPTGAEVIELGVTNATAHQVDECVKIKDLKILADIYQHIISLLFST